MGGSRMAFRGTLALLALAGAAVADGCAPSQHAAYAGRFTRTVRPAPAGATNADVALTFGLDEYSRVALTAVSEQRPP